MKELASAVSVAVAVFGMVPYAIGMFRGLIKPHAFSWLVWTGTTLIAFVGQLVGGGGLGSAAAGATSLAGLAISGYAFWRGDRSYTRLDWLCLFGAALSLIAWKFAGGPVTALVLIALVDGIGAVPTILKAYGKPNEEGVSPFVWSNVKWVFAICALEHFNALTLLFPATTTLVNTAIIAVVLVRRAQVSAGAASR